jgi:hypothetical protein
MPRGLGRAILGSSLFIVAVLWANASIAPQRTMPASATVGTVQSFAANNAAATQSLTASTTTASTAGDMLVATIRDRGTTSKLATVANVTDSAGNVWVKATSVTQGTANDGEIWDAANARSTTSVTVTLSASAALAFTVLDVAGASATAPLDRTATSSGTSTAPSVGPTTTTTQTNEIVISDIGWNSTPTPSNQTAGYTTTAIEQSTVPNTAAGEQAAWRLLSAAGTATYAATLKSSAAWTAVIATFDISAPSPTPTPTATPMATPTPTPPPAPHVMIIVEGDQSYSGVVGGSNAPYITGLSSSYRSATNWYAIQHNSQTDDLDLIAGSSLSLPKGTPYSTITLVDELHAAGIPWKTYIESMPSNCFSGTTTNGLYDPNHNPFHYFTNDTSSSGGWCSSANLSTEGVVAYPGSSGLVTALNSANAPDFVYLVPNDCDEMQGDTVKGAPCAGDSNAQLIKAGDTWLSTNLGPVLTSTWFKQNGIVIITWDQSAAGDNTGCCGLTGPGGHIPTVVVAAANKSFGAFTTTGDHYGTLRALEEAYGVGLLGSSGPSSNTVNGDLTGAFVAPPGSIGGTVTDSQNPARAIAGVTVSYNGGSTTTNTSGAYTLSGVPAGTYTVTAILAGYTTQTKSSVVVTNGTTTTANFTMPATSGISGTVLDTENPAQPVTTATVAYTGADGSGSTTSVNATTGAYTLSGVPAGTYTITAAATGYSPAMTNSVTVTSGVVNSGQNFVLAANTGISGTVFDTQSPAQPIVGASVTYSVANGGHGSTTSGAGGLYSFPGVPPGTYGVSASAANFATGTDPAVLVIAGHSATANLNLVAGSGIGGTVFDSQIPPQPIVGASVTYTGPNGQGATTSGAGGTYVLTGVPVGIYTVSASATNFAPGTDRPVGVTAGSTAPASFNLIANSGINGTVFDSQSPAHAIVGASVTYTGTNGNGTTTSDSAGAYSFAGVPVGTYGVTSSAPNFASGTDSVVVTAGNSPAATFNLNATSGISGAVTDAASGLPIPGAAVDYEGATGSGATSTDANGKYTLSGVPPGIYTVTVSATGYAMQTSSPVTVVTGAITTSTSFALIATTGTISGTALDTQTPGEPVATATVSYSGPNGTGSTTSINVLTGVYSLPEVPAGTYTITSTAAGYTTQMSSGIVVTAGAIITDVDFQMPATSGISGTVLDTQHPALGVAAAVVSYAGQNGSGSTTSINPSTGGFTLAGVPAGTYTVTAVAAGYTTQTISAVTVSVGATASVTLTMPATGVLSGTLVDTQTSAQPVVGATVQYAGTSGNGSITTSAGDYTFNGVPPGTYTLSVIAPGYAAPLPQTATVTADVATPSVGFAMPANSAITGTVSDTEKPVQPAGGASVSYIGAGSTTGGGTIATNTNGTYTLSGVPPGTYSVSVADNGFISPSAQAVTVPINGTATAKFTVTANSELTGTVTDSQMPAQLLTGVSVQYTGTGGATGSGSAKTAATGNYTFMGVPPGTYLITATLVGFTSPAGQSVTVPASGTGTAMVTLSATSGITGLVTNAQTSQPMPGVTITYTGTTGDVGRATATTGADGSYTFSRVSPGAYYVAATECGYISPAPQSVNVGAGATPTVPMISLTPVATTAVCGTVIDGATSQPVFDAGVTFTDTNNLISGPTMTDASGDYTFAGLTPGTYTIAATANGYNTVSQSVTVVVGGMVASPLVLASQVQRDAFIQPFTSTSIWNTPIGSNAQYAPANLAPATTKTLVTDQHIILMNPAAPSTPLDYGPGGQSGNRCTDSGMMFVGIPIAPTFTVPSSSANYPLVAVEADGHTLVQSEPFARCAPPGPATVNRPVVSGDLYGDGQLGGEGGSGLSALGGTIRLGELVPGGVIRHALQLDIDAPNLYKANASTCYRWPATKCDSYGPTGYGGTNPQLTMGALLALPQSLNLNSLGLQTQPGLILATALQDYGAYVGNDAGRSVNSIVTELGPPLPSGESGSVVTDFGLSVAQGGFGFPFATSGVNGTDAWSSDIRTIFAHLDIVTNNGPNSIGGGGIPIVPPPLG